MRIRGGFSYILILSLLALLVSPALGKIIYVDDDAPAPGDGTAWTTAYRYLQDALADANDSDDPVEIRVAQGIYKPDQGASVAPGDRKATFRLVGGVILKGGYHAGSEGSGNARDIRLWESVLSGDLMGNDGQVDDLNAMLNDPRRTDNSYHVVATPETDTAVVIDGFTIADGHADPFMAMERGGPAPFGGAVSNGGYPTLSNCTFTRNLASDGGAVYSYAGAPTLIDCVFHHNTAYEEQAFLHDGTVVRMHGCGGGIYADSEMVLEDCEFYNNLAASGGAIHVNFRNDLSLTHCTFKNNVATRVGGGIRSLSGNHLGLTQCRFEGNSAGRTGGAIYNWGGVLTLTQCLLSGNSADHEGGAMYTYGTDLTLNHCTSMGNRTLEGAALALGAFQTDPSPASLIHCILWDHANQMAVDDAVQLTLTYSNVPGGWLGEGNVDVDPLFVDPGYWDANGTADDPNDDFFVEGDYHLMSEMGRWDPNVGAWVRDEVTSPCIDAGDPNSDVADEVWPHGGRINMGAYGGTRQASLSAEPSDMFLPRIACIYWHNSQLAESCQSFLQAYGCPVTLIGSEDIVAHAMDDYDLILIATDTPSPAVWSDPQTVTALAESGRPVLGLGEGGYRFLGKLGLAIGYPNGAHNNYDSVQIVDPSSPLCGEPCPVAIPEDEILQLYTGVVENVMIYLWPTPPEDVTTLARQVGSSSYYPLVAEQGHLLWGFVESPEKMTETGRRLFLNAVILTANGMLQPEIAPAP